MSSDIKCPYCGHWQDINHDDGYGYTEGEKHEQECGRCEKTFLFETSISFNYEPYCQDGDHVLEQWVNHPDMRGCVNCEFCERIPDGEVVG